MIDWIEWKGGECPVDGDQMVEVRFGPRDTQTGRARWFDGGISHKPSGWKQDGPHESWIIAYRSLATKEAEEPERDGDLPTAEDVRGILSTPPQDPATPSQADREAANALWARACAGMSTWKDFHQAFLAHRLTGYREGMRRAAEIANSFFEYHGTTAQKIRAAIEAEIKEPGNGQ